MKEKQITFGTYGHTLNASQVYSPDGKWVIYDTRNDDTHISRTTRIEKVNLENGTIVTLYDTKSDHIYGPGVGAAAYHPVQDEAIFIHGLLNNSPSQPYSFTRRFGAIINTDRPNGFIHAEGRQIYPPFAPGKLRGGTHAHTWSPDGSAISFTYNDYIMEQLEKETNGIVKDLRTTGMMMKTAPPLPNPQGDEQFGGTYSSFVTAAVVEDPGPGSDAVDRAFDECWIGRQGYIKSDGTVQRIAIAFQGNVRDKNNNPLTEVFVADIPQNLSTRLTSRDAGTINSRPMPPEGITQRRITFTSDRKYPGVQGPRCRLRSSPDGRYIYLHMKDDEGIVQVYRVLTVGGEPEQVTFFKDPVTGQYNLSEDGKKLSCVVGNTLWAVHVDNGITKCISKGNDFPIIGGAHWRQDGRSVVFNRYVPAGNEKYLQIFRLDVEGD
jgi:Tol biopolymer transport system component